MKSHRVAFFRALLVGSSVLTATTSAPAQSAAIAEALFEKGRQAMASRDYAAACKHFRESNALDPSVGTQFNLGECELERGKLATAWTLFRGVVDQLSADDERLPIAKQRAASVAQRLPRLTIRLTSDVPAGTTVKDGDVELPPGSLGIELPVDPGPHVLVVSAPGHESRTFEIDMEEGTSDVVEVAPGGKSGGAAGAVAADATRDARGGTTPSGNRKLGWVLGGVGVAGLAAGSITGVMVLGKKSTADEHCDDELRTCDQEGKDANDSGRALAPISTIGFVVGAIGVGAGAYFLLTSAPDGAQTAVRGSVAPGSGGIDVVHRW